MLRNETSRTIAILKNKSTKIIVDYIGGRFLNRRLRMTRLYGREPYRFFTYRSELAMPYRGIQSANEESISYFFKDCCSLRNRKMSKLFFNDFIL